MTLRLMVAMMTSSIVMTTATTPMAMNDSLLRQKRQVGPEVVQAVVNEIQDSCILPHSSQLLRRLAYLESRDGRARDTFRRGFHGGIWQVSQANYNQTKFSSFLQQARTQIQSNFSIDWEKTAWNDLERPLYSGLAAALYIRDTLRNKPLPAGAKAQKEFWMDNYHGDHSTAESISSIVFQLDIGCPEQEDLDIAFILDMSSSISAKDFADAKNFVVDTISIFDIDNGHTRVALVTFNDVAVVQIHWKQAQTHGTLVEQIRALNYSSGASEIAKALTLTRTAIFSRARAHAVKVAVLLTDGKPDDTIDTAQAASHLLHDVPGIHLLAVGVGDPINAAELHELSSPPACRNSFSVPGYDQLDAVTEEIQSTVCKAGGGNDQSSLCRHGQRGNCDSLAPCICQDEELGKLHCPFSCGHCTEQPHHCNRKDRHSCLDLAPCICDDPELAQENCPHMCGLCGRNSETPHHTQTPEPKPATAERVSHHSTESTSKPTLTPHHTQTPQPKPATAERVSHLSTESTSKPTLTPHHTQTTQPRPATAERVSHHSTESTSKPTTPTPTPDVTTQDQTPEAATTEEDATTTTIMTTSSFPSSSSSSSSSSSTNGHGHAPSRPPPPPSKCLQCGEEKSQTPCTDDDLILGDAVLCDAASPYCMNDIYMNNGVLTHYRRCVNETICYIQWFEGTSDKNLCVNFDPSISVFDLACHLCCQGDGCNIDDVPAKATLYQP